MSVVIVGAGLAGQRCAERLRAAGWGGRVRIVGDERHRPYDRPPLSKALLCGDADQEDVTLRPASWYAEHDVDLVLGRAAVGLDSAAQSLVLADGARIRYRHLVIATGGAPRMLPELRGWPHVHALRTLDDALTLRDLLAPGLRLAVVGAGLVGLEVAASARALGADVTVIEAAPAPLAAVLGTRVGAWLSQLHAAAGVHVVTDARVDAVEARALRLEGRRRIACDAILVAIGMAPSTGWLAGSGLPADGAVATDAAGRTALPHVYAAGDAAGAGHWEAAARQGAAVAATILGHGVPVPAPASFWSDQHGIRLQFVGTTASHDRLDVEGDVAAGDAQVLFLRGERAVGGLLVGRPRDLPALRRLLHDYDTNDERTAA
jgi:NADPH-dependent 2,4-dienoyl-CoA reductase/sulfur reductase-like enzyme